MQKILRKNKGNSGNFKIIFKHIIKFNKRHCVSTWHPRLQTGPPTVGLLGRATHAHTPPASPQVPSQTPAVGAAARPGTTSLRGHQALATNLTAPVLSRSPVWYGAVRGLPSAQDRVLALCCGAAPCWPSPPPSCGG